MRTMGNQAQVLEQTVTTLRRHLARTGPDAAEQVHDERRDP